MTIDLLIAVVLIIFMGKGFVKGFFLEALTFVGFFVALFVAANMYKPAGQILAQYLHFNQKVLSLVILIGLFVMVTFAFALAGRMLTKVTQKLKLTGLNRFFGAVFGGAKGAFICGLVLAALTESQVMASFTVSIRQSVLAKPLAEFANQLLDLLAL